MRLSPINSGEAWKTHGVDRKARRGRKTFQRINDYVGNPYIDCEKEVDVHEVTVTGGRVGVIGLNVMEVAAITGHKDLRVMRSYTHLRAGDLALKLE